MTYEHKDVPANKGANHVPYDWTYANAAARTGASGFVSEDIGKLARQTDDNTLWMLTATTPTWVPVGAGSAFMQTLMDDADAATARATLAANIMRCGEVVNSSTSKTLGASDIGKHHHTYDSPTLTLPPFSVCENGSMLLISCYSGVTTISRNGTEALYTTSSVTSFTLNPGDFAILTTNGTDAWLAMICRATVAQVSPKILTFTRDLSSASGNVDYTGLGFQPSVAMVMVGTGPVWSAGISDGTIQAMLFNYGSGDPRFAVTHSVGVYPSTSAYQQGTISILSDGIRIAWTKTGSPAGTVSGRILCWQ